MNALHGILKSVEQAGHRTLDLSLKANRQILLNDSITAREEGKNGLNEMLLVRRKGLKVVAREVNLLGGPEGGDLLLLHRVEVLLVVGDGKEGVTHDGISSLENVRSVLQEMSGSNRTEQLLQHVMVPKVKTSTDVGTGQTQYQMMVDLCNVDTLVAKNLVVDLAQITSTEIGTENGNLFVGLHANSLALPNVLGTTGLGVNVANKGCNLTNNVFMGWNVASVANNVNNTVFIGVNAGQ